ncbi:MAG: hypothetical protein K6F74_12160 [Prevotella sp.]|nr:hypothetical protein [Prevotella sp.]
MRSEERKRIKTLVNSLLILFTILCSLFTLSSCGSGDDDGSRLGDYIVGTWLRGWNEGDVIIEGDTELSPGDYVLDSFVFKDDGSFNGMVRSGSFMSYDYSGEVLYKGTYRCDNHNLKLEFTDDQGRQDTILAQILSFTETDLVVKVKRDGTLNGSAVSVTVTMKLRKAQSSSSTSDA